LLLLLFNLYQKENFSWIPDDIINNFESFVLDNEAFVFKTKENAFIFISEELVNSIINKNFSTGIVLIDNLNQVIKRDYNIVDYSY
jgi:hypothetical protein